MATISTYVSGHTETADIAEFFQKQLLSAGERPIAFFDGVFYESHQERVGNIAYQDYLIYSDRALYLWARGADKDYLDRFVLGAVSINSRNKDNDFATLNLRIRREGKEPVYVIFDMVEIVEAEKINTLHTIIESIIENHLGNNFRNEVPDEIAEQVFQSARNTCPPSPLSFNAPAGPAADQNSRIGYGQDLLEQYKTSIGYNTSGDQSPAQQRPYEPAARGRGPQQQPGPQNQMPPGIPKGLDGMLPTDPDALKRIAANLKDTIGDAPFKFRDQVMKDLQHVPNDVATVLSAINELVTNIADNPQAEKFVLNAIQTAVKNDGILGSMGKMLKLTTSFGPMGNKPPEQPSSSARSAKGASSQEPGEGLPMPDEHSGSIRRKRVKIQADSDDTLPGGSADPLDQVLHDMEANMPSDVPGVSENRTEGGTQRKKVKIVTDETEEVAGTGSSSAVQESPGTGSSTQGGQVAIPLSVEEQLREALQNAGDPGKPEPDMNGIQENKEITRKRISVQSEPAENNDQENGLPKVYRTMESESGQEKSPGSDTRSQQNKPAKNSEPRGPLNKSK